MDERFIRYSVRLDSSLVRVTAWMGFDPDKLTPCGQLEMSMRGFAHWRTTILIGSRVQIIYAPGAEQRTAQAETAEKNQAYHRSARRGSSMGGQHATQSA